MMNTIAIFFISMLTLFSVPAINDGEEEEEKTAKFEFVDTRHNFGQVEEGPKISHDFVFKNTGEAPLVINNVRASCGCTTPYWPKDPIMPGEESKITAVFNTKGRVGNFNKTITVDANTIPKLTNLKISGEVTRPKPEETMPFKQPTMLSPGGN